MGGLLVHAGAAAVQGVAVVAAAGTLVVNGDRSVAGLAVGRATVAQATVRFGAPTAERASGVTCHVTWRRIGLAIDFLDFAGRPCRDGGLVTATISSRARWRTALGLRVGDSVARLRSLYPRARLHPDGYWLVPRRSCAETGANPYPGLLARVRASRVTAVVVTAGVCE